MNVNPWVIPGSLQNLPPVSGKCPGFHFVFRQNAGFGLVYVTHRMTLTVDGMDATPNLRLKWKGQITLATGLPETNWIWHIGEPVEVIAEFPGGLKPGQHHLKLVVITGGNFGGNSRAGKPWALCEFEDNLS